MSVGLIKSEASDRRRKGESLVYKEEDEGTRAK